MMHTWFECKIRYEKVMENGMNKKVTEPYLVDALSFTEAEARIIEEITPYISGEFTVSDIKRANYSELFPSEEDAADRWFKCKLFFITLDEKSGAEKKTSTTVLVQASDLRDAVKKLDEGMKGTMADYVIASVAETAISPEIRSLELAAKIYQQKINVTRSEHLPSVALMGNYMVTNPSVFNSFENKFKGMWNVGVMVQLPIWHWGEGIYKVKAAKAEARIAQYQLEDAKEKIELQVNQSAFKVNEAAKKLAMAKKNLEKADENLRYATLGFEEGVIAPSNVLEAHTAWLSAQSEKIDAQIDVKLTEIYLQKSLGTLK